MTSDNRHDKAARRLAPRLYSTHSRLLSAEERAARDALVALLEAEGEDAVTRIYALAVARARLALFLTQAERKAGGPVDLDDREHSHPSRVGQPPGRCTPECVPTRLLDHPRAWRSGRQFVLYTGDEYSLGWEKLQHLVDYGREHGLRIDATADSYYFAGRTIRVDVTRDDHR